MNVNSQLTAYIALICTSGVLNLYLCVYVFGKRHNYTNILNFFILSTSVITIYCFASAFGLMSTTLEEMKFWTVIQYVGIPFAPPLGLIFALQYVGIPITKKQAISLLTLPFITLLMVATNDLHHLHYRVYEFHPQLGAPYMLQEMGICYVVHGAYIFGCMFFAFFIVLRKWKDTAKTYRPQLIALMFGQLVPMLTAFIYLLGLTPTGVDPVPMVLWMTSLLYLWSIRSSQLFMVMPIAKESIFNSMNDGVMVLDESTRLIEYNEESQRMFSRLKKSMYGTDFNKVWYELSGEAFPLQFEMTVTNKDLTSTIQFEERIYQVRVSSLKQKDHQKGLLLMFTDITELKKLQEQLKKQAYYDELTKIYNRRAFFQQCEEDFVQAKNEGIPFTLLLIDIDFFKSVNDTYGHDVGDQMLVHVVNACQTQLTDDMLFARYGGEEFVIALKGYTAKEGEAIANQIRQYVESSPLVSSKGIHSVTLSLGVAEASYEEDETLNLVLNRADKALYSAKHNGRNQVQIYREALGV